MKKPISTKIGKTFSIRLDAAASSGYRWKLLSKRPLQRVKLLNEYWEQKSSLFGGSSVQIFIFQALFPGHTIIDFGYIGGRETDKILERLAYHIDVSN